MSVARGFGLNGKSIYMNVTKPMGVFLNFTVDSTNGNGLGLRSIKSNGYVEKVFMNTNPSATTATSVFGSGVTTITVSSLLNLVVGMVVTDSTTGGNITGGTTIQSINSQTKQITLSVVTAGASASAPGDTLSFAMTAALAGNPNPAAGFAWIQFKNNFNYYLGGFSGFVSQTGSNLAVSGTNLTIGHAYIITVLGTTTAADWTTLGVRPGFTPAVGMSFIALATGAGSGSGQVTIPVATGSGIYAVDVIGDPNASLNNSNIASNGGALVLVRFLAGSTPAATAPANNSTVGMTFFFDGSTVSIPDGGASNGLPPYSGGI